MTMCLEYNQVLVFDQIFFRRNKNATFESLGAEETCSFVLNLRFILSLI